jgi:hypothetical protein
MARFGVAILDFKHGSSASAEALQAGDVLWS